MLNKQNFAIIGLGISGQGATNSILKKVKEGLISSDSKVTFFESSKEAFKGFPYSTERNYLEEPLLWPIQNYDIYNETFQVWLKNNLSQIEQTIIEDWSDNTSKETIDRVIGDLRDYVSEKPAKSQFYPPRVVYGYFVEAQSLYMVKELENLGIETNIITEANILNVEKKDGLDNIITTDNKIYSGFTDTIVANGNVPQVFDKDEGIDVHVYEPGFKKHVIQAILYNKNNSPLKFKVVGSLAPGLDGVKVIKDAYQLLKEQNLISDNMQIDIDLVSRSGAIQRVAADKFNYKNQYLTKEEVMRMKFTSLEEALQTYNKLFNMEYANLRSIRNDLPDIKFDINEFINYTQTHFGNSMLVFDLEHYNDPAYRAQRTILENSISSINHIIKQFPNEKQLQSLNSIILANTAPIAPSIAAETFFSDFPNVSVKAVKASNVNDNDYILKIDSRTVSAKKAIPLNNNLEKSGILNSNSVKKIEIDTTSNDFTKSAYINGGEAVRSGLLFPTNNELFNSPSSKAAINVLSKDMQDGSEIAKSFLRFGEKEDTSKDDVAIENNMPDTKNVTKVLQK
jgi:hypothetical protein